MLFADFLNWAMELERVSNYKLAKRLDISQTTVANWRTGKTTPYPKMLERVLDLLSSGSGVRIPARSPKKTLEPQRF